MINSEKLYTVLASYKNDFPKLWGNEKFKWVAVKHFQKYWDINAPDFLNMFMQATEAASSLIASMHYYPRRMIKAFAEADPETVRAMFANLFDESKDLAGRVARFQSEAEALRVKYDDSKQHFQNLNSISTYLWLRYPDKYYIYKYSEHKVVAEELESAFVPKRSSSSENLLGGFKMYDAICAQLAQDKELLQMLESVLTDDCYQDPLLKTLTIDVGFYISRFYSKKSDIYTADGWFPAHYSPGISAQEWLDLLADKNVFNTTSLKIMKRMKDYGGQATCKELSLKYGGSPHFYNMGSSLLAKRVAKASGCPLMERETEDSRWWPILYVGKRPDKGIAGAYMYRLRDELSQALNKFDLTLIPLTEAEDGPDPVVDPGADAITIVDTYTKDDFLEEVYMTSESFDTLASLLRNKKNLILQGAPGVGKTFAAKRLAYAIMGEKDDRRIEFIQFHQNYSYEDFVMGYKPQGDGFELRNGVFYDFCKKAEAEPGKEFFFIIDEINRGNLSKIFGELLMLIERSYRGTHITLAYSGRPFAVPENLYIIGMMNTADRSLAMLDYALRRRFSFFDLEPGFDSDGFKVYQEGFNNETLNILIERIKELNKNITADGSLGKGFCIGHSYFCDQTECSDEWMIEVVEYDILPMLSEYWFDELAKLRRWENLLRGVFNE